MGNGVTVARLTLDQLVKVQILVPQLDISSRKVSTYGYCCLVACRCNNHVTVVEDGVEAMTYLRREGKHGAAPRPDFVLLDLNLPRKNGREVLAEVKQDPDLRRIPVVVTTSSDAEKDVLAAYNNYVNCYITKPVDLNQFFAVGIGQDGVVKGTAR